MGESRFILPPLFIKCQIYALIFLLGLTFSLFLLKIKPRSGSLKLSYKVEDRRCTVERVVILSEVGWDTAYFNPVAYRNLLAYLKLVPPTGILIDGALTRLDRPEVLNDALTYWTMSKAEALVEDSKIPNNEQMARMLDTQLGILDRRLRELRAAVPHAQIVLSIDSDDLQFTVSAILNELLTQKQKKLNRKMSDLRQKKDKVKNQLATERKRLQRGKGSDALVRSHEAELARVSERMKETVEEMSLYREKKTRPIHQQLTAEVVAKMYGQFQEVCDRYGVELIKRPEVLTFGELTIDFAHSRYATWTPARSRAGQILKAMQGKKPKAEVVLESGHSGHGYKQYQKLQTGLAETNFQNAGHYDPVVNDAHVTLVLALPFEDQAKIAEFMMGGQPMRLAAGKPIGSRNYAAFQRYKNDSVSGLTVITKDGQVGTEWVQYQNFLDGSVLHQPKTYHLIAASSDEHIASPEENALARDGFLQFYRDILRHPILFRGRPAFAAGYINGGDVGEANSDKWQHRYGWKKDPRELLEENIRLLQGFNPQNEDQLVQLAFKMTGDAMQGGVESMQAVMERVANYWMSFLQVTLAHSSLRFAHAAVVGNHTDDILRRLGLRESDFFVQRLRQIGVEVLEVGKPLIPKNPRVAIGGYSSARILQLPDYGLDIKGKPLFGPINLLIQHDPKGTDHEGLIGAGKNVGADVALAGHTHDNWLRCFKTGENTFSVAYRLATLQTVTPTEKFYASSVPRTQGAHLLVMPARGDFSEKVLPVSFLSEIGRKHWRTLAKAPRPKTPKVKGRKASAQK